MGRHESVAVGLPPSPAPSRTLSAPPSRSSASRTTLSFSTSTIIQDIEAADPTDGPSSHREIPPSYEQSFGSVSVGGDAVDDGEAGAGEADAQALRGGVNARFGRWRGWVEKRALERGAEDEGRAARREARRQIPTVRPPSYDASVGLPPSPTSPVAPPLQLRTTPLPPTDLCRLDPLPLHLPHSTHPPLCSLSLTPNLTLLGTSAGLRILNTLDDAESTRAIWFALPVREMHILKLNAPLAGATPRGSVLLICGACGDGMAKRKGGGGEARVYKLESLASLGMWSATQPVGHAGLDMKSESGGRKGKGRGSVSGDRSGGIERKWAEDYMVLPGSDVLTATTHSTTSDLYIALCTPSSILLHRGISTPSGGYAFGPSKCFALPFAPDHAAFIRLASARGLSSARPSSESSRGDAESLFELDRDDAASMASSLPSYDGDGMMGTTPGLFVTFGSRACIVRVLDSAVMHFKLSGKGVCLPVEKVRWGGGDAYVFTRGRQTFIYAAPLEIPLSVQAPLAELSWPSPPVSLRATELSSSTQTGFRLFATTAEGTLQSCKLVLPDQTRTAGSSRLVKEIATARGCLGASARLLPTPWGGMGEMRDEIFSGGGGVGIEGGWDEVWVGAKGVARDWRVLMLEDDDGEAAEQEPRAV